MDNDKKQEQKWYFFIARPRFAMVISIFITILGLISIAGLKLEEYPNITPVQISVSASYPGASAEVIENSVASLIESQVNGVEDMTMVDNYQTVVDVTPAFNGYLPRKGDTINVTWNAVSNVRLRNLYARPVDCSAAAGGWRELLNVNWDDFDDYLLVRSAKANEPFIGSVTFKLTKDTVEQFCLCIWYDIGDAWPNGPAIIKMSK